MITIRRIRAGESDLYKQVRLASLQEAPYAFSSTYEGALQRSDESWREQVERTAEGSDRAIFLALAGRIPVGVVALYRIPERAGVGELLQVWVAPEYRGKGVAWNLLDAVFAWAAGIEIHTVIAGVLPGNRRALNFYTHYGFTLAGEELRAGTEDVVLLRAVGQRPAD